MRKAVLGLAIVVLLQFGGCKCSTESTTATTTVASTSDSTLEIKGTAQLLIPAGALPESTIVHLSATQSKDAAEAFEQTIGSKGPGSMRRAAHETVVDTGKAQSIKNLKLTLNIPPELRGIGANQKVEALVEYVSGSESELHDVFQSVDTRLNADGQSVTIDLEPSAFSAVRNKAETQQAVIVLAVANPEQALPSARPNAERQ